MRKQCLANNRSSDVIAGKMHWRLNCWCSVRQIWSKTVIHYWLRVNRVFQHITYDFTMVLGIFGWPFYTGYINYGNILSGIGVELVNIRFRDRNNIKYL